MQNNKWGDHHFPHAKSAGAGLDLMRPLVSALEVCPPSGSMFGNAQTTSRTAQTVTVR